MGGSAWAVLDTLPDAIVVSGRDGRVVFANGQACELTGYERGELLALSVEDLVPPRLRETHVADRLGFFEAPQTRSMGAAKHLLLVRRDGTEVPVDVSLAPLAADDSLLVVAALRDVSSRRDTERALEAAEARYRSVFDNAIAGIFVTTTDGRYLDANRALARMLGYGTPAELIAAVPDVRALYVDSPGRDAFQARLAREGAVFGYEYRVLRADGSVLWVSENVRTRLDERGNVVGYEGTSIDITERRAAEESLRRRDRILGAVAFAAERFLESGGWESILPEVLRSLGEAAGVERVILFENHRAADGSLLTSGKAEWTAPGVSSEIALPINQDFPWQGGGFERWAAALSGRSILVERAADAPPAERPLLETLGIDSLAAVPVFVDGDWWGYLSFEICGETREWEQAELDVLRAAAGALGAAVGRSRSETQVVERQNLLSAIIETEPECVKVVAPDGTLLQMNRAGLDMIEADSAEQVVGRPILGLVAEEHRDAFDALIRRAIAGEAGNLEFEIVGLKGTRRWFESSAAPLRDAGGNIASMIAITRDVTERRRADQELRESLDLLRRSDTARRRLAARLLAAEVDERARLAERLQSDSIQQMTAASLRLETLRRKIGDDPETARAIEASAAAVGDAISRLQGMMFELHPSALERDGLAAALRALCRSREIESSLGCVVEDRLQVEPSPEIRALAFRMILDALHDVQKRATATRVWISLEHRDDGLLVRVRDDGSDSGEAPQPEPGRVDLVEMRERAEVAGGRWRLEAAPEGGAVVEFWLPGSIGVLGS
ncbi:MAG: PAS domain S-box protein [Actinobacteria bacterium]|nr:PAS domain S-box protein [Actinomycetota bacterium]